MPFTQVSPEVVKGHFSESYFIWLQTCLNMSDGLKIT